jgi:hypothetical protein
MKPEEFDHAMENLKTPRMENNITTPIELKLAIVNAKQSGKLGIIFTVIPALFLLFVLVKYYFKWNFGILQTLEEVIIAIDKNPNTWWIQPILLLLLPVIGIVLNVLSIIHASWNKPDSTLVLTVKMKWRNLIIIGISLSIITIFLLYLIGENFQARIY